MLGSAISNAPANYSFASSYMHMKGIVRKVTGRWERARWGLDYRIVNKIVGSLKGV